MPIYEFYCPANHRIYSFFARSMVSAESVPRCPDDPTLPMQRMVSGFAVTGRAREQAETPAGDAADDPRMERMMAEMEREMGALDDDNPDPRAMARLMRKMADMSGEKMPESMEEMIRRLEAGEDPEALEEQFGALDDPDGMGGLDDPMGGAPPAAGAATDDASATRRPRRKGAPQRDPKLYELRDFL
jgi:hypothetical protein